MRIVVACRDGEEGTDSGERVLIEAGRMQHQAGASGLEDWGMMVLVAGWLVLGRGSSLPGEMVC